MPDSSADAAITAGLAHHQRGELQLARQHYQRALSLDPQHPDALHLLGVLTHLDGDHEAAGSMITAAIGVRGDVAQFHWNLGLIRKAQRRTGEMLTALMRSAELDPTPTRLVTVANELMAAARPADAAAHYRRALTAAPDNVQALIGIGESLRRTGEFVEAKAALEHALKLNPTGANILVNLGALLFSTGDLAGAEAAFRRAIAAAPDQAGAYANLGELCRQMGRGEEALALCRRAAELNPNSAVILTNLGLALRDLGRLNEAVDAYRVVLGRNPDDHAIQYGLGVMLLEMGQVNEAIAALRKATQLKPDMAEAHCSLGNALRQLGRPDQAAVCHREAVRLKPDYAEAFNNLGTALSDLGQFEAAIASYREALRLTPDSPLAHNNLGSLLLEAGRPEEAAQCFREALRRKPDLVQAHSNLIFALDLVPDATPAQQQEERRRWSERHGSQLAASAAPHANDARPERTLRIGYVSADFRRHASAACAFVGVLRRHGPEFDIFLYSNAPPERADDVTEMLRTKAHTFRNAFGSSDDKLAAQIRADGIDILVDLSGHMRGGRLPTFARRPAPIQITAWGNATGTGLAAMDYMLGDAVTVPTTIRTLFAEDIVDLPCLAPYEPLSELPPVSARDGASAVTFGCFNRLAKITTRTMDVIGAVLAASPASRMLFKGSYLDSAELQATIMGALEARGVTRERVAFRGLTPNHAHLSAYADVDIALDPTPHGGGISTYEALVMGVPVVTLLGATPVGRFSASILTAIGMTDWIAADADAYVEIAARKAAARAELARLRGELRTRLTNSPVGDLDSYTRAVETAYRGAWRRWCEQKAGAR